ncbi:MAG: glycosyltransferase [Chloroflexota bacterium]|nr:MAG: hypothetical protein DLM70_11920 [Chloroflexota bacterium]
MTSIVVSGSMVTKLHNGGEPWVRLSWLRGLMKLGFDVYFVEQICAESCVDEAGNVTDFDSCVNRASFDRICDAFGLSGHAALVSGDGTRVHGMSLSELHDLAGDAALLINITGHLSLACLFQRFRLKIYIDEDPGFTQFWHATGNPAACLAGHDHFYTVGLNLGTPACSIPTCGIVWRTIRQPVVLDDWPVCGEGAFDRFTTVATWRSPYGSVEYDGKTFGPKAHAFRDFAELPELAPQQFEIALDIHPDDRKGLDLLRRHGWRIVDPRVMAPDPPSFRHYIQTSGAEFSVAQAVYVDTNSGWFSDRTVRYLASGKPALVQDTGFSSHLPIGEGLLAFRSLEDAVAGAAQIADGYDCHCIAARVVAEEYFDSDTVLGELIEDVGVAP